MPSARVRFHRGRSRVFGIVATTLVLSACDVLSPSADPVALAFVQQPSGAEGGTALTTPPIVEIRDAAGHRVRDATGPVKVALGANPAGGSLSGSLSVNAVDGVAVFSNLAVDKVGSGYTLTASAAGLTSATSASFDVEAGPPNRIRFATQPAGALGGTPFATQPVVELVDAGGNLASGAAVDVVMAIGVNPANGHLSGTKAVTTSTGMATFTDLSIDKAGTGYTLDVSAAGLTWNSFGFDVAIGPPSPDSSLVSVIRSMLVPGDTATLVLRARDAGGNSVESGGATVGFLTSGGTTQGRIGSTTDHGDGTYTARFVVDIAGTPVPIHATLNGSAVTTDPPTVTAIPFASVTVSVQNSPGFSCGVTVDGVIYCWGNGTFGTMGDGSRPNTFDTGLHRVAGNLTWSAVAAGGTHACGLTTTGAAYCWGWSEAGALGNGTQGAAGLSLVPTAVAGNLTLSRLTAGDDASCAIDAAGTGYCWGSNLYGRLGNGTYQTGTDVASVPHTVAGGMNWGFVVVRGSNGCGISTAGAAYCWGINGNIVSGGTDDCDGVPCAVTPVPVAGGLSFRDGTITIGAGHLCAVATGGSAYCWGINYSGQLGDGTNTHASSPVPVAGGFAFLMLAAADLHTCGVTDQHSAYCWGNNTNGWLGTGTDASTNTPQLVAGGFEFSSVSTGDGHTCAVTLQGGVLCWGLNGAAQLGHGAPTPPQLSPVWLRFQ
jgi:hypothetical protein